MRKPARFLLLACLALLFALSTALGSDASDAIRDMKRVVENPASSNADKADAIRELAQFGRGRDAKKVVKALFDLLKDKSLLSDRELQQLERELQQAEELYQRIYDNCKVPGGFRFSNAPENSQAEMQAAEAEVIRLRNRLRSNATCKNAVVETLGQMRETEARDEILDGVGDRDEDIAGACIEAIRRQRWRGGFDAVVEAYRNSRSPGVRGLAILCLRQLSATDAKDVLLEAINDDSWLARAQAIAGLRDIGDVDAIDALVNRMGEEPPGRLRWDIVEALRSLTDKEFGDDPPAWRSWWHANKDGFNPVPPSQRDNPNPPLVDPDAQQTGTDFYGVPVRGNPLFIIDRSGSMISAADDNTPGNPVAPPPGKLSKWAVVQRELFEAIDNLDEDKKFGIVFYDTDVYAYKDGAICTATNAEKREVRSTISPMQANGLTNIYGAFQRGFDMITGNNSRNGGPIITDGAGKLGLDEIFFLTDGSPTCGESINGVAPTNPPNREYTPLLLEKICDWNSTYNLVINTICVGMGDTGFMQQLAQRNRGVFVHVTE